MKCITLLIGACFMSLSCSAIVPHEHEAVVDHILAVDRDGNGIPLLDDQGKPMLDQPIDEKKGEQIYKKRLSGKDNSECEYDSTEDHIARIIRNIKEKENKIINEQGLREILIYVHGGLNDLSDSFERAISKYETILEAKKYPVFVNWRSGAFTTYADHLVRQREGKRSRVAPYTSPIYLLTDMLASVVTAPKAWMVTGTHSYQSTIGDKRRERDEDHLDFKDDDNSVFYTGKGDEQSIRGTKGRSTGWIITSPVKLITTPFAYTMAKPAWDVMEQRTRTMFRKPEEYEERYSYPRAQECFDFKDPRGTGALSVFLQKLSEFITQEECVEDQCETKYKITIIGHSMGTMVADEIVRVVGTNEVVKTESRLRFDNIVFMGAAVSTRRILENIVPYLEKHEDTKFYNLSLHPQNEDREAAWGGLVPSGTLLVWIDTMYTTPESRLDKTAGRWSNIYPLRYIFPEKILKNQMRFKIFGLNPSIHPQYHGQFDEFPFWQPEFWWKPMQN